jgi:hypothetical protein
MPLDAIQPGATALTRTPYEAHSNEAGARRARVRHAGHAVAEVGRHVDDGAAVLLETLQEQLAHHQEAAGEVVGHHRLEAALADGHHRRRKLPAGVVDQAMDNAFGGNDIGDAGLDGVVVADVERAPGAAAAVLADLAGHALELVGAAPADHHVGTERREFVRHGPADARAPAGDPQALAGEQPRREDAAIARRRYCGVVRNGRGCRHGHAIFSA